MDDRATGGVDQPLAAIKDAVWTAASPRLTNHLRNLALLRLPQRLGMPLEAPAQTHLEMCRVATLSVARRLAPCARAGMHTTCGRASYA